jgi:hypothetical protein
MRSHALLQSKFLLIVLEKNKAYDGFEYVETCRLIDYIVVLCATVLSRNIYLQDIRYSLIFMLLNSVGITVWNIR